MYVYVFAPDCSMQYYEGICVVTFLGCSSKCVGWFNYIARLGFESFIWIVLCFAWWSVTGWPDGIAEKKIKIRASVKEKGIIIWRQVPSVAKGKVSIINIP